MKRKKVFLNTYKKDGLSVIESDSFIFNVHEYTVGGRVFCLKESKQKTSKTCPTLTVQWDKDRKSFTEQVLIGAPKSWLTKNGFISEKIV